jgi:hypothetical protein
MVFKCSLLPRPSHDHPPLSCNPSADWPCLGQVRQYLEVKVVPTLSRALTEMVHEVRQRLNLELSCCCCRRVVPGAPILAVKSDEGMGPGA